MENEGEPRLPRADNPATPAILQIPKGGDGETSWLFVRDRLYKPFSQDSVNGKNQYIECYTAVVNFFNFRNRAARQKVFDKFYANVRTLLCDNLQTGVKSALSLKGDGILAFYISSWKEFQVGTKHNARVLEYMSRHYVKRLRDEGVRNVYNGQQLHAIFWTEEVFDKLEYELRTWVREVVEVEQEASGKEKLEEFKECYNELTEELKGSEKGILPWDQFCRKV